MRSWLRQGGGAASGLIVVEAERPGRLRQRDREPALARLEHEDLHHRHRAGQARPGNADRDQGLATADDQRGVLHGSLYLQGGGDPALGTPAFYDSYLGGLGTDLFALKPQIRGRGSPDHRPPLRR